MNMTSSRPYMARALYEWILDNDGTPYILVDADTPGVFVPDEYVRDGQVVFNISPVAVRDFNMDNELITFRGSFGGVSLDIEIPVNALLAIYARENGQGMVFEVDQSAGAGDNNAHVQQPLGTVDSSGESVDSSPDNGGSGRKGRKGKPHLSIVK